MKIRTETPPMNLKRLHNVSRGEPDELEAKTKAACKSIVKSASRASKAYTAYATAELQEFLSSRTSDQPVARFRRGSRTWVNSSKSTDFSASRLS